MNVKLDHKSIRTEHGWGGVLEQRGELRQRPQVRDPGVTKRHCQSWKAEESG